MHVVVFLQQRLRWLPAFARRRRHKVPDGSRNKVQAGGAEEEAVGGSLPRRRRRREGGLYLLHLVGPAQAPPPLQAGKQEPRGRGGGEVVLLVLVPLVAGVLGAKTVVCSGEILHRSSVLTTADCCISPFGNFQAAAIWAILVLPSLVNLAVLSISISFAADGGDATTTSFFVVQPSGTNVSYGMLVRQFLQIECIYSDVAAALPLFDRPPPPSPPASSPCRSGGGGRSLLRARSPWRPWRSACRRRKGGGRWRRPCRREIAKCW